MDWFEERPTCTLALAARLTPWEAFAGGLDILLALAVLVPVCHAALRVAGASGLPTLALPIAGGIALALILIGAATVLGSEVRTCPDVAKTIRTTSQPGLWLGATFALVTAIAGRVAHTTALESLTSARGAPPST